MVRPITSGEGILLERTVVRLRTLFIFALFSTFAVHLAATPSLAAGALAIGKCGAYGQAFDYPAEQGARAAALKQCKGGGCSAVTMKRACAALSLDMAKPCGAHGYAVAPRISTALNEATRKCYAFGGKECVIRAWACDARG
ncbi:MAG: DUF4189 domain-containing protein [Afipia sp.]|nr:DUF4189 domain-containing protein [Afipia sp.]